MQVCTDERSLRNGGAMNFCHLQEHMQENKQCATQLGHLYHDFWGNIRHELKAVIGETFCISVNKTNNNSILQLQNASGFSHSQQMFCLHSPNS